MAEIVSIDVTSSPEHIKNIHIIISKYFFIEKKAEKVVLEFKSLPPTLEEFFFFYALNLLKLIVFSYNVGLVTSSNTHGIEFIKKELAQPSMC